MKLLGWMKPEYVLRPGQVLRRVGCLWTPLPREVVTRRLPWGLDIRVRADEAIGQSLAHLGVYDLVLTEALWRLCDEGETAVDVGANIGYATSVLARRVGRPGRVLSFEAHPGLHRELEANLTAWRSALPGIALEGHCVAVSSKNGTVLLEVPNEFLRNRGVCRVSGKSEPVPPSSDCLTIPCDTLDSMLGDQHVGVAKMDVEGHEEAVLLGASELLSGGRVRDWVFEHHGEYPSPVTTLFEENSYAVFKLQKSFFRPVLLAANRGGVISKWEPPSYLATKDPIRAASRFEASGWRCLRGT